MTEILAPAGDILSARAALTSGADAIYLGLTRFSARSGAENFGCDSLSDLTRYAHLLGAKVYVCLNTLVKDGETEEFFRSVRDAWNAGADALLVQDLFLARRLKEACPSLVLHLSTQAGCCSERGAKFARECGVSRVVAARETPLSEIRKMAQVIETEVFVQGALCTCFSGQCYLSSFAGNNSGNRGRCKQPCRKRYCIDRKGFEEYAYALSPSDLKVGERVKELIGAGVVSLKIEGRMRRPEYVAAAVSYYRALLGGEDAKEKERDLTRAYNRGDYTEGLAFGQSEGFLSRKVQGHIGERVGYLGKDAFVESDYLARKGDGFKILRDGKEVGGALFARSGEGGFYLTSGERLKRGDEVRLTTDSALGSRLDLGKRREVTLDLRFVAGERATIECGDFLYEGELLPAARSAPLSAEELIDCFRKTDLLPFRAAFGRVETDNAFLPKSALNALRREFYKALSDRLAPRRPAVDFSCTETVRRGGENARTAVIATSFDGLEADVLILKPCDYRKLDPAEIAKGKGEKYLYLPAFFTGEDEALVRPILPLFDGIYSEGFYGLSLAKEAHMPFFAGTGFNLTNRFGVEGAFAAGAKYVALSKELTQEEQRALSGENVFALCLGSVKVMELGYCPFGRTCGDCDKREFYRLSDEEGRTFPLRRFCLSGSCRFELFNCDPLAAEMGAGALVDLTGERMEIAAYAHDPEHAPLGHPTRGHKNRSLL